jgi:hypothetical protein
MRANAGRKNSDESVSFDCNKLVQYAARDENHIRTCPRSCSCLACGQELAAKQLPIVTWGEARVATERSHKMALVAETGL